ncbi:hypothetical protein Plhal304r1_c023g0080241 [Plasmopara halstedii]
MKLSLTFTFVSVTVTSFCASATVVDDHHENATVLRHNTLPWPCRDRITDNQRVHLSASVTSSNEKAPLIRDGTHSANEERGSSISPDLGLLESAWQPNRLITFARLLHQQAGFGVFLTENLHPYTYLKLLHNHYNTWDKRLIKTIRSLIKGVKKRLPNSVDEPGEVLGETELEKKIKRLFSEIPDADQELYNAYADLYTGRTGFEVIKIPKKTPRVKNGS